MSVIFRDFPGGTEEKHEAQDSQSLGRGSNRASPKYKSGASTSYNNMRLLQTKPYVSSLIRYIFFIKHSLESYPYLHQPARCDVFAEKLQSVIMQTQVRAKM
jgi:hypothetical protein